MMKWPEKLKMLQQMFQRILSSGTIHSALIIFLAVMLLFAACSASQALEREYKVTIEVSGVTATATVTYTDLATTSPTDIFSEAEQTVPYSKELTGTVDYTNIQERQVTVTADVAAGETLSVTVYYEEVLPSPPEGNIKTAAEDFFENSTGSSIAAWDIVLAFSLPLD